MTGDISARLESVDDVVAAIQAFVPEAKVRTADAFRPGPEDNFDVSAVERLLGTLPATPLAAGVEATIRAFQRTGLAVAQS